MKDRDALTLLNNVETAIILPHPFYLDEETSDMFS